MSKKRETLVATAEHKDLFLLCSFILFFLSWGESGNEAKSTQLQQMIKWRPMQRRDHSLLTPPHISHPLHSTQGVARP